MRSFSKVMVRRASRRAFWFIVDKNTWPEHLEAGIAAINDPHATPSKQSLAQRQAAMAELAGIRPGDLIFFYVRQELLFLGLFEATTEPFYDPNPLYPGATYVDHRLPFRVSFRQKVNYPVPIHLDDIWEARDKGLIWSIQQHRGDAVGRHACNGLASSEARVLIRMFREANITKLPVKSVPAPPASRNPLPIDTTRERGGYLRYENALKALLLEDLADGYHKEILGDYDDFLATATTSEREEMDILLIKYDNKGQPLWFHVLELKRDTFTMDQLRKLIDYEKWLIRLPAGGNRRAVHASAIAYKFDAKAKKFLEPRVNYGQKPIRLIQYQLNFNPPPYLELTLD